MFGSKRTIKQLLNKYTYCFLPRFGYQPIMKAHTFKNRFRIYKKRNFMEMIGFDIKHGLINASGFLFNKIAYISDCNGIPKKSEIYLKNLDCLIVDCLRNKKHPSHFNLEDSLNLIKKFKPKKAILTNLHVDFDYDDLKKKLPKNIIPAYDGLSVSF